MLWGSLLHAAASAAVALAPATWIALPAIFMVGMAWISTANTLSTAAQLALPNWVRARGMAIYQMALMGGGGHAAASHRPTLVCGRQGCQPGSGAHQSETRGTTSDKQIAGALPTLSKPGFRTASRRDCSRP